MRYFAYELLSPDSANLGVDTTLAGICVRLKEDLSDVLADSEFEGLETGEVYARNLEEALDEIRLGHIRKCPPFTAVADELLAELELA